MLSSGSEHTSWDYNPPKKLQTTLLSDSPRDALDLSSSFYLHPVRKTVTPKDNTRANSPLHMSSVLFSSYEDNEEARNFFEQLVLIRDRHTTLKSYINSIRAQLQQSFNLAIAELQGKRNLLISQVDLLYDENFTKLCNSHKEKEKRIQGKDDEVQSTLDEIEDAIQKLESGGWEKYENDLNRILNIWVSENEVSGEWAEVRAPEFNYNIVESEGFRRNSSRCQKRHRSHKHENCRSKNRENKDVKARMDVKTLKPPRPEKFEKFELESVDDPVCISTLYTSDSGVEADGRLRVYVPHGYPSYTCFYLVRTGKEVKVGEVLEKISLLLGGKGRFELKVKEGGKMRKIEDSEKAYRLARYKLYLERVI